RKGWKADAASLGGKRTLARRLKSRVRKSPSQDLHPLALIVAERIPKGPCWRCLDSMKDRPVEFRGGVPAFWPQKTRLGSQAFSKRSTMPTCAARGNAN